MALNWTLCILTNYGIYGSWNFPMTVTIHGLLPCMAMQLKQHFSCLYNLDGLLINISCLEVNNDIEWGISVLYLSMHHTECFFRGHWFLYFISNSFYFFNLIWNFRTQLWLHPEDIVKYNGSCLGVAMTLVFSTYNWISGYNHYCIYDEVLL